MSVLPDSRLAKLEWFEQRLALWAASAATLEISAAQITDLQTRISAARAAYTFAHIARNNAKSATANYYAASDNLNELGRILIRNIKTTAETTGNPQVYILADVPEPAEPSPLGPPPIPTDLLARLSTSGIVHVTWKCTRRGGTSFQVFRSLTSPDNQNTPYVMIGVSEEQKFTDSNVPAGYMAVTYKIVAGRGGGYSDPSDPTILYFGAAPQQQGNTGLTLAA